MTEKKIPKPNLPGAHKVKQDLERYLDKTANEVVITSDGDLARLFYLRPSSFPYCGLRFLLEFPSKLEDPRVSTLSSAYFTSVGTTVHSVFQEYTSPLGKIVGDWSCKCGAKFPPFSTYKQCECGRNPLYEELELKYMDTVVGHTDTLYRLSPAAKDKSVHAVVDYKTTSSKNVKEDKDREQKGKIRVFPYKSNKAQIESYVPMLEQQYGISVDYWILVYLARDAPFSFGRRVVVHEITRKEKERIYKKLERSVKVHRKVLKVSKFEDTELIKKYKLCKSLEDYKENWKDDHGDCPFYEQCFKPKELDTLLKATLKKHKVFPIIEQAPENIRKGLKL